MGRRHAPEDEALMSATNSADYWIAADAEEEPA